MFCSVCSVLFVTKNAEDLLGNVVQCVWCSLLPKMCSVVLCSVCGVVFITKKVFVQIVLKLKRSLL